MNVFYPTDVSRLSVNLRFSSLLLFLLQIEACWRRSVKGAVHRVLHKHQAKQEKSRSPERIIGQVPAWTPSTPPESRTHRDRFIYSFLSFSFIFSRSFDSGVVLQVSMSNTRWRRFLTISWSCCRSAAELKHTNHTSQHHQTWHVSPNSCCVIKMIYVCNFRKWWATDRKSETCWFESELIQMIDIKYFTGKCSIKWFIYRYYNGLNYILF